MVLPCRGQPRPAGVRGPRRAPARPCQRPPAHRLRPRHPHLRRRPAGPGRGRRLRPAPARPDRGHPDLGGPPRARRATATGRTRRRGCSGGSTSSTSSSPRSGERDPRRCPRSRTEPTRRHDGAADDVPRSTSRAPSTRSTSSIPSRFAAQRVPARAVGDAAGGGAGGVPRARGVRARSGRSPGTPTSSTSRPSRSGSRAPTASILGQPGGRRPAAVRDGGHARPAAPRTAAPGGHAAVHPRRPSGTRHDEIDRIAVEVLDELAPPRVDRRVRLRRAGGGPPARSG